MRVVGVTERAPAGPRAASPVMAPEGRPRVARAVGLVVDQRAGRPGRRDPVETDASRRGPAAGADQVVRIPTVVT
jgi:hypothetical protein